MPALHSYHHCLSINRLTLFLKLGVTAQEREQPQRVEISMQFYFPKEAYGAARGQAEYLCYHDLSVAIHDYCVAREFTLIESLAHDIYSLASSKLDEQVRITLHIRKCRILLPYVEDGATYSFSDLPAHAWVVS